MFRKPLDIRIQKFWAWFTSAELVIGSDSAAQLLTKHLRTIDKHLVWGTELGRDGLPNVLEISPDGQEALADLARRVVAAAPQIERWKTVAFRQPVEGFSLELPTGSVGPEDCKVALYEQQDGARGLQVYLPDDIDHAVSDRVNFLMLDHTLGEEIVLRFAVLPPLPMRKAPSTAKTLLELRGYLQSL